MNRLHSVLPRIFLALALPALACSGGEATDGTGGEAHALAAAQGGGLAGEVTAVRGPGGLTSPALDAGTFLGAGGQLQAGIAYAVPKGTMVELRTADGGTLRLNEESGFKLPATGSGGAIVLDHGELVALATSSTPLKIESGGDTLTLSHGEAQLIAEKGADRRHYAVVHGDASLVSGGETIPLGPGASIATPLEDPQAVRPNVSLQPLEGTAWSRTFDQAARLAAEVPRGVGSLTARRAGTQSQSQVLSLVDQRVHVSISGRIARTEIEQTFHNDSGEVLEGTYKFPIPADASISGLQLLVGNRWMDGEMLEKQRARQIFKQIVDATIPRDPALLDWQHGNMFSLKIFPIPGHGNRKVRLAYTQVLPAVGDTLRYRYPLGGSGSGASGTTIDRFAFSVDVDKDDLDGGRASNLRTPMLPLDRRDVGDRIELSTVRENFYPAFDIGVDVPVRQESVHTETHLDRDGQAYFMTVVRPKFVTNRTRRMTDYVLVMDRSHGTTPELWTAARGLWEAMAETVNDGDRIAVLACDTACDVGPGALAGLSGDRRDRLNAFLDQQVLAGASDLGNMMARASSILTGTEAERVIVYLGDGVATSGEMATDKLVGNLSPVLRDVRVEAVAMGARSDTLALEALTRVGGGSVLLADARDDLRQVARELQLRAAVPVARDVTFELPPGMEAVHPRGPVSVRSGEEVVLVGKLRHPVDGQIAMHARLPSGQPFEKTFPMRMDAQRSTGRHQHLARTWAQEEIEWLTSTRGYDARQSIIDLSQEYTVMSRYTALLVLENDAMYREFGVQRRARNKDAWSGKLAQKLGGSTSGTIAADKNNDMPQGELRNAAPAGAAPSNEALDATRRELGRSSADESQNQRLEEKAKADDRGSFWDQKNAGPNQDPAPPPAATPAPKKEAEQASPDAVTETASTRGQNRWDAAGADEPPAEAAGSEEELDDLFDEEAENAPRPSATAKPSPAKKRKARAVSPGDGGVGGEPLSGYGGGSGRSSGGYYEPKIARRPRPHHRVREATRPSNRVMARIDRLRDQRDSDPTRRNGHRRLVRSAIAAGHPDAFAYAEAWALADPDHPAALRALADMLAARGDVRALRAYASAVEVQPFSKSAHLHLAQALEGKRDLVRACSHRRALVSIDPQDGANHAALALCLAKGGLRSEAASAVADGRARAQSRHSTLNAAATELDRGPLTQSVRLHDYADLNATLTWSGQADLDIVVVDPRGRRLSTMWADKVKVDEQAGRERLTLRNVRKTHFVEVTRADGGKDPIVAQLRIKTPGGSKTFPVEISQGTIRVARVTWSW